jgi:Protein of unknown function (DUF998)
MATRTSHDKTLLEGRSEEMIEAPSRRARDRDRRRMLTQALLVCGIASSLLYGVIIWVIRYKGYSPISQTVSELSAWGVSTRTLWIALAAVYTVLVSAFGFGVWASAGGKRNLRVVGGLLVAYGMLGVLWPFAAMHQRQVLAAGGSTLADTGHLVLAGTTVLLMFAAMAFGAGAFGKRFRAYSIATIAILLVFGALTSADASRVAANLSTPWVGLWERINIGVFLLWVVVLAIALLRRTQERVFGFFGHAYRHRPRA